MAFFDALATMLASPLMQRGLMVAVLVGISAPVMGTYLVQRRLALLGDGIGHVALTGVAMGWLAGSAAGLTPHDLLAVPGAVVAAVIGAVLIEVVREKGKTSGDVALALLFYGGIAGGVLLIGMAGGTAANLTGYLFGSISTVTALDVWLAAGLAALILGIGLGLRPALFALSHDEEFARATGLPVRALNILIAVLAALTVSVSMRVVGVLLVSALMIVPVAIAQLTAKSFRAMMGTAMILGAAVCVTGLSITYFHRLSPGATIVVLAIGVYAVVALVRPFLPRPRHASGPHLDADDDVRLREEA
ncbi:metal ABC transporter permease [Arthrobacter nitrophenolicus]|uniref:Metal ABC transporter permease n=1 Tax=Arthrobacter nitrophenolicus TaxID=683150 RepID=A0A4R5Y1P6_9MICC|nr:metal ABC transporter permease [Arthrobacter nitrophenolicus]TDL37387.1 metal ABC transporter permease [Arthrobacter nitrophenolicus]